MTWPPVETWGEPGWLPLSERGMDFGIATLEDDEPRGRRGRDDSDWKQRSLDCA